MQKPPRTWSLVAMPLLCPWRARVVVPLARHASLPVERAANEIRGRADLRVAQTAHPGLDSRADLKGRHGTVLGEDGGDVDRGTDIDGVGDLDRAARRLDAVVVHLRRRDGDRECQQKDREGDCGMLGLHFSPQSTIVLLRPRRHKVRTKSIKYCHLL